LPLVLLGHSLGQLEVAAPWLVHRRFYSGLAVSIFRMARARSMRLRAGRSLPGCFTQARPIGQRRASADFAQAAPAAEVQVQCFEGMYPEIFNDLYRPQVFTSLKRW